MGDPARGEDDPIPVGDPTRPGKNMSDPVEDAEEVSTDDDDGDDDDGDDDDEDKEGDEEDDAS